MTIKDEKTEREMRWLDANCDHLGIEKYSSLTARLEAVEKENVDYKKWLEFYGIEVVVDEEGVGTKFRPSTMDKWRKAQNDSENAKLRAEVERLEEKLRLCRAELKYKVGGNL